MCCDAIPSISLSIEECEKINHYSGPTQSLACFGISLAFQQWLDIPPSQICLGCFFLQGNGIGRRRFSMVRFHLELSSKRTYFLLVRREKMVQMEGLVFQLMDGNHVKKK